MYVLRVEITHELDKRFQASLHNFRTSKLKELAEQEQKQLEKLTQLRTQVDTANENYQKALTAYKLEVAGKGVSGFYGEGDAARASLLVAERLKLELNTLQNEMEKFNQRTLVLPAKAEIVAMEQAALVKDFQTLRVRFGINDVPDSFVARSRVVREVFANTEEFRRVETAVWSLLGFLAGALFLLKYFQPDSVLIYFSEVRQGQWHEYLNGTYDHLLELRDQSIRHQAKPLAPLYFRKLWDEVIEPALSDKGLAEALARMLHVEDTNQENLKVFASLEKRLYELDIDIPIKKQELEAAEAQRQQMQNDLKRITDTVAGVIDQAVKPGQQQVAEKLPDLNRQQRELEDDIRRNDSKIVEVKASLNTLQIEQETKLIRKTKLEQELEAVYAVRKDWKQKQQALAHASIERVKT